MENPKYEFIKKIIDVYIEKKSIPKLSIWLKETADGDDIKAIYARRVWASYDQFIRDFSNEKYGDDIMINDKILLGIIIGVTNERLDISEL